MRASFFPSASHRHSFSDVFAASSRTFRRNWASRTAATPAREYDVVVVGAGAAGLTAAHFASHREGSRVAVLERTKEAGKKVLMSGGSRCNILPAHVSLQDDYFTESSLSALRAVFASWSLEECLDWLTVDLGLELHLEAADNKYFPASNSAREVRDKLVEACATSGVTFRYDSSLVKLSSQEGGWTCLLQDGTRVHAGKVVFATGGMSFPLVNDLPYSFKSSGDEKQGHMHTYSTIIWFRVEEFDVGCDPSLWICFLTCR